MMFRKIILVGWMSSIFLLIFFKNGIAVPPVDLKAIPDSTTVPVGSGKIVLTALVNARDLKFSWKILGPGQLETLEGSTTTYIVPDSIEGEIAQTTITVIVTDQTGQEISQSKTFEIVARSNSNIAPQLGLDSNPTPVPEPTSVRKSSKSFGTKAVLGVGAAALIGGVAALGVGGGDDKDEPPFTGTFKGPRLSDISDAGPYTWRYTLNLRQSEHSITGTLVKNSTLLNCCQAEISASVAGSVDGTDSANLTWGAAEGLCECSEWRWHIRIEPGSGHVSLINAGKTLRFDGGAEYTRAKLISKNNVGWQLRSSPEGDFIRE